MFDDGSHCWWITVLLVKTRLHHSVVPTLKSATGYVLLWAEICIRNCVIRQYILRASIWWKTNRYINSQQWLLSRNLALANFFYSRCRLCMFPLFGVCLFWHKFFSHNFSFFLALQSSIFLPKVYYRHYMELLFLSVWLSETLTLSKTCTTSTKLFTTLDASGRLLQWAREVLKEIFY